MKQLNIYIFILLLTAIFLSSTIYGQEQTNITSSNEVNNIQFCKECNSAFKAGSKCPVCEMKKERKEELKLMPEIGIVLMAYYTYTLDGITNSQPSAFSMKNTGANRFNMERIYLTVKKNLNEFIGGRLILDISSDGLLADQGGLPMIVKNAYLYVSPLGYVDPKLKDYLWINFGIIPLPNQVNDAVWNQRFVERPFLNKYKFMPTGDFGASINGNFFDLVTYNLAIVDGIGYLGKGTASTATSSYDGKVDGKTSEGNNNFYKDYYGDITITPFAKSSNKWLKGIGLWTGGIVRSVKTNQNDTNIFTIGIFYKNDLITLGIDGYKFKSVKYDIDPAGQGYSGYMALYPYKPFFILARYDFMDCKDKVTSTSAPSMGLFEKSHYGIIGIGAELAKGARVCLDMIWERSWNTDIKANATTKYLGMHTELKF